METHPLIDRNAFAQVFGDMRRAERIDPLDNTRIANLMSAEKLTFDEAKARVVQWTR